MNLQIARSSNQSLLIDLVDNLSLIAKDQLAIFTKPEMIAGNVSVGKQVRHILDFYTVLIEGLDNNVIDYDKRERDLDIEENISIAIDKALLIHQQLQQITDESQQSVIVSLSTDVNIAYMQGKSTLLRELQFIHSHTTHHMAIISIMLRLNQMDPGINFGKAPSTIAYEEQLVITH